MRNMEMENEKELTLKYLYGMIVEMRSKIGILESKTHIPHSEMRADVATLVGVVVLEPFPRC